MGDWEGVKKQEVFNKTVFGEKKSWEGEINSRV